MSDPRMISKDAAKRRKSHIEAAGMTGNSEYRHWWTIAALHEQVERQAAQIERVREALKALRDYYIDREARSRERLESVTDEREQFRLARFAHSHRRTHEALTRILEAAADHAEKAAAHAQEEGNDE